MDINKPSKTDIKKCKYSLGESKILWILCWLHLRGEQQHLRLRLRIHRPLGAKSQYNNFRHIHQDVAALRGFYLKPTMKSTSTQLYHLFN